VSRAAVVVGRDRVARQVRAAGRLMADLAAPPTARAPWLTSVLNADGPGRPAAVVVEGRGRLDAAAFLHLRRRGSRTVVTVLGDGVGPVPGGRPPARLLARDDDASAALAEGIAGLLGTLLGRWRLQLAGLPMGDPTARRLAATFLDGRIGNVRSRGLVDLDGARVRRSREPAALERELPFLLDRVRTPAERSFLRATARLHAAIGQLEVATTDDGAESRAVLLTLVDGVDRWPWWGARADRTEWPTLPGAPLVGLDVPARGWPPLPGLRSRGGAR
jgi:hypothetical protein